MGSRGSRVPPTYDGQSRECMESIKATDQDYLLSVVGIPSTADAVCQTSVLSPLNGLIVNRISHIRALYVTRESVYTLPHVPQCNSSRKHESCLGMSIFPESFSTKIR